MWNYFRICPIYGEKLRKYIVWRRIKATEKDVERKPAGCT